ncbi:MAG: hypothetical protein FWB76_01005 [Oscillospiraceae bacterium]|nr:hypothetical protein [Oscillospiraceae bacterium]
MKRIAQLTLVALLALALVLPAAAIANIDGSEPEWDGYAGIRPMSDVLVVGDIEPDVEPIEADPYAEEPNRAQFARSNNDLPDNYVEPIYVDGVADGIMAISAEIGGGYAEIEPINYPGIEAISAETGHSVPVALFYATLAVAVLALVLAVVALVKKK